jgi:tetratricopeptide (TPR) repeat protein
MPDRKVSKLYSHTLAAALALSALAVGAIHLPIVVAYATLVLASGCLALAVGSWFVGERRELGAGSATTAAASSLRTDIGAGVWFALSLVCLLQALPLPLGWLEHLAPSQADVWARALRPFGAPPPELASLSLAPHRTLVEALKMATYGVIFYVSARLGRQGMGRIAALAFASAVAVALVTLAHRALGAERLFGLYTPNDTRAVAPLLNPNSRAGYLNLGFFCGLGLLFRVGPSPRGTFFGVGLVLLTVEILLCQSRGGTACLMLGMLLVPLLRPRAKPEPASDSGKERMSRAAQVAIVGSIAAGAAVLAIVSRPPGGFGFDESLEKLELFGRAAELVRDHPLWGVGRGAFGSAFSAYQPGAGSSVFEYAENLPLQWAAEWGVPVTVLALGALAWSLRPVLSRRSLSSPVRRCALIGAGVLGTQNLVDLGLEITAVAALLVYVLGGLLGAALSSAAAGRDPRPRLLPFGCALTLLCIGLTLAEGRESPARERDQLHAELAAGHGLPAEHFWAALRSAVLAYPADPYFPLLGASAALAAQRDALPWAASAIEKAPGSAPAQLALGRALWARHATDQALGALRRAIELDPARAGNAIRLGLGWRLTPELLARAVPDGPAGTPSLELLADASQPGSSERVHWLEEALAREPESAPIHYRIAHELWRDVLLGERGGICRGRRDDCLRRASEHAALALSPPNPAAVVLQAQLLELSEGPRAAEERLAAGCEPFPGDEGCARALFALALKNQSPRLPGSVRNLIASGCATRERCAATHTNLGNQYAALGQWRSAQNHFRQATLEWPTADNWRSLANAFRELGQAERAEDAVRRAELLEGKVKGAELLEGEEKGAP